MGESSFVTSTRLQPKHKIWYGYIYCEALNMTTHPCFNGAASQRESDVACLNRRSLCVTLWRSASTPIGNHCLQLVFEHSCLTLTQEVVPWAANCSSRSSGRRICEHAWDETPETNVAPKRNGQEPCRGNKQPNGLNGWFYFLATRVEANTCSDLLGVILKT